MKMDKITKFDVLRMISSQRSFFKREGLMSLGKSKSPEIIVISPGLKVFHKKTRYSYQVYKATDDGVLLIIPDSKEIFFVSKKGFEKDYIL